MNAPTFQNRWRILGTLTTRSELHIGNGGTGELTERHRRARKGISEPEHDVQTVCIDHSGRAYLPSTALRGPLRSLLVKRKSADQFEFTDARWTALFGTPDPDAEDAVGGKLIFYDAFWKSGSGPAGADDKPEFPYWSATRRTCVATSVSLDRRRRTAAEHLLYQVEYVPAGETFEFEIGAENVDAEDIAHLLALLETLNVGISVGALASSGWGHMSWQLTSLQRFTSADVEAWKKDPKRQAGLAMTRPLPEAEKARLLSQANAIAFPATSSASLEIQLQLQMTSPWIVRDARQKARAADDVRNEVKPDKRRPGASPMLDEKGRPFIPAKSFCGLLRSQAERILRTLGFEVLSPDKQPVISPRLGVADALHQVSRLDLAAQLFGASGWRAPLQPSRLSLPKSATKPDLLRQEFVAVDRFTGGAADALKFNADFAPPCSLQGSLTLDLDHISQVESSGAYRGLLALVLRDLAEGDLTPGAHAAIGCGACTATATITDGGQSYASLQDWFASQPVKDGLKALRDQAPAAQTSNPAASHE